VDIDSDHVVAVVWRGRLHLLWITWLERAVETRTESRTFEGLAASPVSAAAPAREALVQLNWSELFEGEWTPRQSSDFSPPVGVGAGLSRGRGAVHVAKTYDGDAEGPLHVHLGDPMWLAFTLATKNGEPTTAPSAAAGPRSPYTTAGARATRREGTGPLHVAYVERIETQTGTGERETRSAHPAILSKGARAWTLLGPSNGFRLVDEEIGSLVAPMFYQDDRHTFFVEPELTETTLERWETWIVYRPVHVRSEGPRWADVVIEPAVPVEWLPVPRVPGDVDPISSVAKYKIKERADWVTNPATALKYDQQLVGKEGALGVEVLGRPQAVELGAPPVVVAPGSDLAPGEVVVAPGGPSGRPGVVEGLPELVTDRPLAVIGGGGLSPGLLDSIITPFGPDGFAGGLLGGVGRR
jgi:hypothetical protein